MLNRTQAGMPIFYYDLMSPYAYLAAERVERVLPEPPRWQPVLLGGLFKLTGRSSGALGDYDRRRRGVAEIERRAHDDGASPRRRRGRAEIGRGAHDCGVPPLRWPDRWPSSSLHAMRAAIHARRAGRERDFA